MIELEKASTHRVQRPTPALPSETVLAIRPGRPWPSQTRSWPTQTARVITMIPTYTTPVGLPKICLAFDWPTQMKIPKTAPDCLLCLVTLTI